MDKYLVYFTHDTTTIRLLYSCRRHCHHHRGGSCCCCLCSNVVIVPGNFYLFLWPLLLLDGVFLRFSSLVSFSRSVCVKMSQWPLPLPLASANQQLTASQPTDEPTTIPPSASYSAFLVLRLAGVFWVFRFLFGKVKNNLQLVTSFFLVSFEDGMRSRVISVQNTARGLNETVCHYGWELLFS